MTTWLFVVCMYNYLQKRWCQKCIYYNQYKQFIVIILITMNTDSNSSIDSLVLLRHTLLSSKNFLLDPNYKEILREIESLIKQIDIKVKGECRHVYVEDYIDVDVERSQRVCYCSKCWSTFPNN